MAANPIRQAPSPSVRRRAVQPVVAKPVAKEAPAAIAVRDLSHISAPEKAVMGVKMAGEMAPGALKGMWDHKGEVLKGFVAPFIHPIKSLQQANAAVKAAAQEDPVEAVFAAIKHHGSLISAWMLPISLALIPFTGGASMIATAASLLGMATLGATGASLAKNVYDASQAQTDAQLRTQSVQILEDGIGLGTAAVTYGATKGVEKVVKFARGRYGPEHPVAAPAAETMEPATMKAHRQQVLKAVSELSDDEIRALELTPVKAEEMLRGNSVKMVVQDSAGRKYLFKPLGAEASVLETETAAMNLRRAAGEPTVAAVPQKVKLADGTVLEGYVKPFVKNQGNLVGDPTQWTSAQRHQVLADHGWAEFLGNYDTKSDQSVRIGETSLNVDWDHALSDYATNAPLSRFKSHNPAPPAQNLLYREFVKGKLDLDFRPLFETIDRIQGLPDAEIRAQLKPFVDKAFAGGQAYGPYANPEAFMQAVLARKSTLKTNFTQFVARLQAERDFNLGRAKELPTWGEYVGTAVNDAKQEQIGALVDTELFGYGNQAIQTIKKLQGGLKAH